MEDVMKILFTAHAFVSWLFGLALLVTPVALLALYGITADPASVLLARLFGGALVGLGVAAWFARVAVPSEGLRALILGDAVISILGCLVCIQGTLSSTSNALGWLNVAIFGFFAVGFGMLAGAKVPSGKAPMTAHP
jgi:hypothetical protein